MVEEMLAARGIIVSHESVRQWARKFGQAFANQIRRRLPATGDKWHLDKVVLKIAGKKHWLWRAVDQDGIVLDILVQSRRDKRAGLSGISCGVGHDRSKGACPCRAAKNPIFLMPCLTSC
jgi:transposase-like protein